MKTADLIKSAKFQEAKQIVRDKLATDPAWLVAGLMAIHKRQTADEQQAEDTKYQNRVGFNSADARKLTGFARQWQERHWFSDKQMNVLRRMMNKYAGQLTRIARGEPATAGE